MLEKIEENFQGFERDCVIYEGRIFVGELIVEVIGKVAYVFERADSEVPIYETMQPKRLIEKVNKLNRIICY